MNAPMISDDQKAKFHKGEGHETLRVDPGTLSETRIFSGEHVVTGGEDGQVYIAAFADHATSLFFIAACVSQKFGPWGDRAVKEETE